jgi:hypothetical protein
MTVLKPEVEYKNDRHDTQFDHALFFCVGHHLQILAVQILTNVPKSWLRQSLQTVGYIRKRFYQ